MIKDITFCSSKSCVNMDCKRNMKKYDWRELENKSFADFENSCDDYFNEKHLLGHLKKVMHLEPK